MPYPYFLHAAASEEYIEAYEWYEKRQKGLGERFMKCVEKRLKQISDHPQFYSTRLGNFREVKVEDFPYMIVYEFFPRRQVILISAIYHAKRNPRGKRRRR